MWVQILITVFLAILSGVLYRMGGSGNYSRWIRPVGVASCATLALALIGYINWSLILCFGAFYGLSTTYFKKEGTDAKWFNWFLVGLGFSVSVLPIVLVYHIWVGFAVRTVVCAGLIILWSQTNGNAVWEEGGRGFIPIATIPLLLLGA